jgi:mycothiol synthase
MGPPATPESQITWRAFRGAADYPQMLAVLQGSKAADAVEDADTLEGLAARYAQLANCDPARDMIMLEQHGRLVGYGRTAWSKEVNADVWLYDHMAYLLPAWRRQGLGNAMLGWLEQRAKAAADELGHPRGARLWQTFCRGTEQAKQALLERAGYAPARTFYLMLRPSLGEIPACPLPAGLELRPVRAHHLRAIWEAHVEAFRDHWSQAEATEADFQEWLTSGEFQPEIWKVAWDRESNQVAGMVLGYINHEQNKRQGRRRGWTENIGVRRPWRRRGLARALMAANLRELKARGMTEAALGVDSESLTGALRVYESMGFQAVRRDSVWRKPMPVSPP